MKEENLETRIDALDKKLDLVLEYVNRQRLNSVMVEDLVNDLSLVGKDAYDSTVAALDNRQVEIDPSQLTDLAISVLRNIGNIKLILDTMEMAVDLGKEVGPIANEVIIDFTRQLSILEEKGYFRFFKEFIPILDNVVQGFTPKDIRELADSVVSILRTLKEVTQPEVLNTLNNAIKAFNSMETESVPSYSVWKLIREMNSPEMKKALGYGVTFMKNVSRDVNVEQQ